MSDLEAVTVLAKVRDCHSKDCNLDCEHCELNYSDEEFFDAISTGIDACLERSQE